MSYNITEVSQNKKQRLIFILLASVIFIAIALTNAIVLHSKVKYRYTKGLDNKIIVLDPGHGGVDPGTKFNNLQEKEINMAVVRKLEKEFRNNKVKVILTRAESQGMVEVKKMSLSELDDNLQKRKALAYDESASLFVSVHVNSSPSKQPSGAIVYYQNTSPNHYQLAKSVQNELNKLYAKKWSPKEANFVVIRETKMPSVLVEIGFMTNPRDRKFLSSSKGQELITKGIFQGIKKYTEELN